MKSQKNTESIRLAVKPQLKTIITEQARMLGVNVSTYIKHLIISDAQRIPTFMASESIKIAVKEAMKGQGVPTNGKKASEVLNNL